MRIFRIILACIIILVTFGAIHDVSSSASVQGTLVGSDTLSASANIAPIPEIPEPILNLIEPEKKLSSSLKLPFYSQFSDITSAKWKKVGCGIASLAMVIEYHKPESILSVDALLNEGIEKGAYLTNAGWTYKGLINVASKYGFTGESHDFASLGAEKAFARFKEATLNGPVIASVHYTFDPANPIPHLVVVSGIDGDTVYYNDPAEKSGGGSISKTKFIKAWKMRYIEIYPSPSA